MASRTIYATGVYYILNYVTPTLYRRGRWVHCLSCEDERRNCKACRAECPNCKKKLPAWLLHCHGGKCVNCAVMSVAPASEKEFLDFYTLVDRNSSKNRRSERLKALNLRKEG